MVLLQVFSCTQKSVVLGFLLLLSAQFCLFWAAGCAFQVGVCWPALVLAVCTLLLMVFVIVVAGLLGIVLQIGWG